MPSPKIVTASHRRYPHDVWLHATAVLWQRVGTEEHLCGRTGLVGDELGSMLIAGRLVRDLMRLAFFMEREYPPYPKVSLGHLIRRSSLFACDDPRAHVMTQSR